MRKRKMQMAKEAFKKEEKPVVFYQSGNFEQPNRISIYDGEEVYEFAVGYPSWCKYKKHFDKQIEKDKKFLMDYLKRKDYVILDNRTKEEIRYITEEGLK